MPGARRFGQLLRLRPEAVEDYTRHHAAVWPEVLEAIQRAGMRNYSIYLHDGWLFGYFEYIGSDFEADMRAMGENKTVQRWWSLMEPLQEPLPTRAAGEWWASMTEVFHVD